MLILVASIYLEMWFLMKMFSLLQAVFFPNDGARLSLCHDNSDSREAINKSTIDFPNHADYVIVQRNIIRSSASTYPIFYLILFLKLHFTKNCYLLCKSLYCRSGLVEGKKKN
jgi:hypothetical protein